MPVTLKGALSGHCPQERRGSHQDLLVGSAVDHPIIAEFQSNVQTLNAQLPDFDLRIRDGSFKVRVPDDDGTQRISTVRNSNLIYYLVSFLSRCINGEVQKPTVEKTIIDEVNLYFEPGKMYLVLYVIEVDVLFLCLDHSQCPQWWAWFRKEFDSQDDRRRLVSKQGSYPGRSRFDQRRLS